MSPYYLYILQAYTFSNGCTLQGQRVYRVCANICEHITWYNMLILWPSIFVYCTYPKIRWLHNYFVIIIWVAIKLYTIIMLSILKFIAQTWKHAHIYRHTNNGSPSPAACQFGITWYHKPHQAAMTVWSESKPLLLRVLKSMRLLFDNWRLAQHVWMAGGWPVALCFYFARLEMDSNGTESSRETSSWTTSVSATMRTTNTQ